MTIKSAIFVQLAKAKIIEKSSINFCGRTMQLIAEHGSFKRSNEPLVAVAAIECSSTSEATPIDDQPTTITDFSEVIVPLYPVD